MGRRGIAKGLQLHGSRPRVSYLGSHLVPPDEKDGKEQHKHDEEQDGFDPVGAAEHRAQELRPGCIGAG